VDIHTRSYPKQWPDLPPVSASQAKLILSLLPQLPTIVKVIENELIKYEGPNSVFAL
jgi:hypothetical protein